MAGGTTTRQYVKLTKDQDPPMEKIKSGELNQPKGSPSWRFVDGQSVADEAWTTGIFGCFEGLVFGWWMCGIYVGLFRQSLQKKHHLKNSPLNPCMVHCCMHWCANCQEHQDMKGHLSGNTVMPMAVISPPAVQEMNANEH